MLQSFEGHNSPITALAFSESGLHLATVSKDSVINIWNLRTLECLKTLTHNAEHEVCLFVPKISEYFFIFAEKSGGGQCMTVFPL